MNKKEILNNYMIKQVFFEKKERKKGVENTIKSTKRNQIMKNDDNDNNN